MQRWEYCRIVRGMGDDYLLYNRTNGSQGGPIKRDKSKGDKDDAGAVDRLIAELGLNGWEMVGASNHGYLQWLFFKRPLS